MIRALVIAAGSAVAIVAWAWTGTPTGDPEPPPPPPAPAPTTAPPSTTEPPAPPSTTEPPAPADDFGTDTAALRDADAADPFVVMDGRQPWLFTTNSAAGNVPVVTGIGSRPGKLRVSDALPTLPDWAEPGFTWAPAVTGTEGGWVLAFTARDRGPAACPTGWTTRMRAV
jgi:hypothetical protein